MTENPYESPPTASWTRNLSSEGRNGTAALVAVFSWLAVVVVSAPDHFRILSAILLLAATMAVWCQVACHRDLPGQVIRTFIAITAASVSFAGYLISTVF